MSKIRIKNFGPIKEGYTENDGWLDINKITVFIGNQGSGKSTVAKVISVLTWLEKAIYRGDVDMNGISNDDFYDFFDYQRIKSYFKDNTEIEYLGKKISIKYRNKTAPQIILLNEERYAVPKIMYVPAERNFLSVVKNAYGVKNLPDTLYTFAEELKQGQLKLNGNSLPLPIGDISFHYNKTNDTSILKGEDYELDLLESSSGYQSFVPLYLVTKFLSDALKEGGELLDITQKLRKSEELELVLNNKSLTHTELLKKTEEIKARYLNTCFVNIVEEPEQNLFPSSQWEVLKCLLQYNNMIADNQLVLTTHSPYIISYLTLSIEADRINDKIKTEDLRDQLRDIISLDAIVNPDDVVIYQLDEKTGTIELLGNYKGLPSDENYLNENLAHTNDLFSKLLDLEDLCQ
ncbi:MAG: AAA family ATPase [Paludibacter sp.]|nr:AAA family ATPase [Paludibacter sp.]